MFILGEAGQGIIMKPSLVLRVHHINQSPLIRAPVSDVLAMFVVVLLIVIENI